MSKSCENEKEEYQRLPEFDLVTPMKEKRNFLENFMPLNQI